MNPHRYIASGRFRPAPVAETLPMFARPTPCARVSAGNRVRRSNERLRAIALMKASPDYPPNQMVTF